jgi:hypothetical protein
MNIPAMHLGRRALVGIRDDRKGAHVFLLLLDTVPTISRENHDPIPK